MINQSPYLFTNHALLPQGWAKRVLLDVNADGRIASVKENLAESDMPPNAYQTDVILPGIPNAHSHAFQRGMAGLTERGNKLASDNFWSWRELMYQFVSRLQPSDAYSIARHAYIELLRHGYTSVCEFHYLHHDLDGQPYESSAEMAAVHVQAAIDVGLRITLLPVLYHFGGFDGSKLQGGQRRFQTDPISIVEMIRNLRANFAEQPTVNVGVAAHSLRAASIKQITELISAVDGLSESKCPIHLHIAEQRAEVEDCRTQFGLAPVEYLSSHFPLDSRWNLVHATHATSDETRQLANSAATVILCPMTEANLGDGIFPAAEYVGHAGRFAIGSDSYISVSPWEELRMLEYGQRLIHQQRNVLCVGGASTGVTLLQNVVMAGNSAAGHDTAGIRTGAFADLISINTDHSQLAGRQQDAIVDTLVFTGEDSFIRDVFVGGKRIITSGYHVDAEAASASYRDCIRRLLLTEENN